MSVENGKFDLTGQTPREKIISKIVWTSRIILDPTIQPGMKIPILAAIALEFRFNLLP